MTLHYSSAARQKHSAKPPSESFGDFPKPQLTCNPHRFRAMFPDLWRAFLRAHYRDHMEAAYSLGVSEKTGRDWWEGVTGANGASALYAIATNEGAMQFIINEVRKAG